MGVKTGEGKESEPVLSRLGSGRVRGETTKKPREDYKLFTLLRILSGLHLD